MIVHLHTSYCVITPPRRPALTASTLMHSCQANTKLGKAAQSPLQLAVAPHAATTANSYAAAAAAAAIRLLLLAALLAQLSVRQPRCATVKLNWYTLHISIRIVLLQLCTFAMIARSHLSASHTLCYEIEALGFACTESSNNKIADKRL
jgi:hypothetical protein